MSLNFRRNAHLLLIVVLVLGGIGFGLGGVRIIAYVTRTDGTTAVADAASDSGAGVDYTNEADLFDDSRIHSIQIIMDPSEYDKMITTYTATGLKEYFHADIILDGVRINDVGIRLKGNSSLQTALGRGQRMGQRPAPGDQIPGFPQGEALQPPQLEGGQAPEGFDPGQAAPTLPGQAASGETKIPFQVKFDEFVDGQAYQGYERIALRTYGITSDAALLHEPVTNVIMRLAGQPAAQTAYASLQINTEDPTLYVLSEILDEDYLARWFDHPHGVLYKAELGSTLSYLGEDPSAYSQAFSQETRENEADLAPLIAFLRFLDQSSDEEFAAGLADMLDVEAFATYLAINNLLVNADSMIGMNNNYYLYYDDQAQRFTVLIWDTNESLDKLAGGSHASFDLYFADAQRMVPGNRPGRGFLPGGEDNAPDFPQPGVPGGGQNSLMERFLETPAFLALYEQKLAAVYQLAFVDGALQRTVAQYAELVRAANPQLALVDLAAYDAAVAVVENFIQKRGEYLASTPLLGK